MRKLPLVLVLSFGLVLFGACGGEESTAPQATAAAVAKQAGDAQTAAVGTAVATAPSVRVTDASGGAVAGVQVTFSVASGGGSVTGGSTTTGTNGVASVGAWTLGNTAGANSLTATVAGSGITGNPITFTATGTAGPARTLTKEAGDNQTASPGAAVTTAPSVKLVDQFGNPVSGVTVTFAVASGGGSVTSATPTTNASGVAAVGSWTLGSAAGANTLTATATGAGITGSPATFTATGATTNFNPTSNTTLSGTVSYGTVTIPAGVTVTVSSDLVLTATGAVNIAGALTGDCKAVSINTAGVLTVSGSGAISNSCTTAVDPAPALTLIGRGGYHITGTRTITSSGDVLITNDPTLPSTVVAPFFGAPIQTASSTAIDYDCEVNGATITVTPNPRLDGTDGGATGGAGKPGKSGRMSCRGNALINNVTATAEAGGRGGNASDLNNGSAAGAIANAGAGGDGATLLVHVTAQLDLTGTNSFTGGAGGNGGSATASSAARADVAAAPSAIASGGKGGEGGTVTIRGLGGLSVNGQLNITVGAGGKGGDATATAADGANASTTKAAQIGGAATAVGGDGGGSPDKTLQASGTIGGAFTVTVTGGNGGLSGFADATAGKGGDGSREFVDGAAGGAIVSRPGRGGSALVKNLAGNLVGLGGTSADAIFKRGLGGAGFTDCTAPLSKGGKGGDGGAASGGSRFGGTGVTNGADGVTREIIHSNGGNGGHGLGPGARGEAGANNIIAIGVPVFTQPVFQPGVAGRGCRFTITITVANDPAPQHEEFVRYTTITIIDALVNAAGTTITFTGEAGGRWITVTGAYNSTTGAFTATGSGTAAGFAGVPATFTGTINLTTGAISGQVTLSGNAGTPPGGLPGHGTTYNVNGTVSGVTPG